MKLQKIAAAALLCGTLVSSASAGTNYKLLNSLHASASYGLLGLDSESTTSINYEFGYDYLFENYMVGFNYVVETPTDEAYFDYGSLEFDFGYRVNPQAHVYALLSYDFTDEATAGGMGFGVGAKYQVFDSIALMSKLKYSSMSPTLGESYGKSVATVGIEFNFRKKDGSTRW